jgi:hypothetical protein
VISQAAGHPRGDQRAHQACAVSHSNRKVRNALAVQVAQHARVGDQVVRQHHEVDGVVGDGGVRLAAFRELAMDPSRRYRRVSNTRLTAVLMGWPSASQPANPVMRVCWLPAGGATGERWGSSRVSGSFR